MSLRGNALKSRIVHKQKLLEAQLAELKADAQGKAANEIAHVKHKLAELGAALKDGWDNLSDRTAQKLSEWLDHS